MNYVSSSINIKLVLNDKLCGEMKVFAFSPSTSKILLRAAGSVVGPGVEAFDEMPYNEQLSFKIFFFEFIY